MVQTTNGVTSTGTVLVGVTETISANGSAAASPSTTADPSQAADTAASELNGSKLTVVTATIGSGEDAMVATLTSVVPGPVVTADGAEQQLDNGGVGQAVPVAAAALGLAVAILLHE